MSRWATYLVALVLALNAGGLIYVGVKTSAYSSQGAKARARQCAVAPTSDKVYADAGSRGVISASELRKFRAGVPARCLK